MTYTEIRAVVAWAVARARSGDEAEASIVHAAVLKLRGRPYGT